jgi:glycosyltransferase involved in cell wall biosynthesis
MVEYQNADIVHLHNIHGGFFDIKAISQIAAEKPVVWSLHDMWSLTGGEAYTFENENYLQGNHRTPYSVFYPMNSPGIDTRRLCLALKKKVYERAGEKLTMVCDALWLTRRVEQSWVHSPKNNIETIRPGIDLKTFRNIDKRDWLTPRIVVVYDKNNPFKGSDLLGNIFKEIKEKFDLTVIGSVPEFSTATRKTVVHPWFTDAAALQGVFNANDVFIFPSKAEIFPLTVLIAMACGLCVAASDVGGISEAIIPGCGVLLDPTNPTKSGQIIDRLLVDLGEIRAIGRRAAERIHKCFSEEAMFNKYDELYMQVLTAERHRLNSKVTAE